MKIKGRLKLLEKQLPFRKPSGSGDNCDHIYSGQSDSSSHCQKGLANDFLNTAFLSDPCCSPEGAHSEDVCVVSKHTLRRAVISKDQMNCTEDTYNENCKNESLVQCGLQ